MVGLLLPECVKLETGSESFRDEVSSATLTKRRLSFRMLMRAFSVLLGSLADGAGYGN